MRVRGRHGIELEREEQEVMRNRKREEVDVKRTKEWEKICGNTKHRNWRETYLHAFPLSAS